MNAARVEFAHVLRGLAAAIVLVSHFLGVFWLAPDAVVALLKVPAHGQPIPSFVAPLHFAPTVFNYGSLGVAIFFLISGFVIPFSLGALSRRGFCLARFFRIYPVYWVALSVSILSASLIQSHFLSHIAHYEFKHLLSQALLLRGWLWLPSIDGVSWTLEIEIVFYLVTAVIGPRLLGAAGGKVLAGYCILSLAVCVGGAVLINGVVESAQVALLYLTFALPFTIYMFIGTLFYLHMRGNLPSASLVQGAIFVFFCFCVSASSHSALKSLSLSSYLIALVIFSAFYLTRDSFRSNRVFDWLADISYPLYAVHAVVGYSLMYVLLSLGWRPFSAVLFAIGNVLLLSWLIHSLLEKRCTKLGKHLAKKFFP